MSARRLNSLTGENPELRKQIGCMKGIFQIFDRRHFINDRRRINGLPSDQTGVKSPEQNRGLQGSTEKVSKNSTKVKQRISSESSRISFSSSSPSSCSSSFSSLDKTAQFEPSSLTQSANFPANLSGDFPKNQTDASWKQDTDEPTTLSVKTAANEKTTNHTLKHIDSPRPTFQPRNVERVNPEKGGRFLSVPRSARRLSFDERESHDKIKSTIKIKELPRLSLDSKERSARNSNSITRSNALTDDFQRADENCIRIQEPGSSKRSSTLVAKLMGLEAFPDSMSATDTTPRLPVLDPPEKSDLFAMTARTTDENRQNRSSESPRISPRLEFPTEMLASTKGFSSSYSVYGEIEKRLATLEFKKSGKDLRALKQILQAMHTTKAMLDEKEKASDFMCQKGDDSILDHSSDLASTRSRRIEKKVSFNTSNFPRSYKSPIVIIKPSKLVAKTDPEPVLSKPVRKQMTKDLSPKKVNLRNSSKTNTRDLKSTRNTNMLHPLSAEISVSSSKSSENMSPRLQRKFGMDANPLMESSRIKRRGRLEKVESGFNGTKLEPKSPNLHQKRNGQARKIRSEIRDMRHQEIALLLSSNSDMSSDSHIDREVTRNHFNTIKNSTCLDQDGCRRSNPAAVTRDNGSMAELHIAISEKPSPISVLDSTFYSDDSPSPIKNISHAFKDDDILNDDDTEWNAVELAQLAESTTPHSPEISNEEIKSIPQPGKNLERASTDLESCTSHIAPLSESLSQQHRYISEILLASGLLRELEDGWSTTQFHPTGHLINPNLFLALERTKPRKLSRKDEQGPKKKGKSESIEKMQRKLVFDSVNEILVGKLVARGSFKDLNLPCINQTGRKSGGMHLLKELCSEVDQLLNTHPDGNLDEEQNSLESMICEDLMHQSKSWEDNHNEIAGVVLAVERLIFKDLITEII